MDFAVKIYQPWFMTPEEKNEGEKRFFREAKILFSLNHPNIVRIYDAGRIDGNLAEALRANMKTGRYDDHWFLDSPVRRDYKIPAFVAENVNRVLHSLSENKSQ